MMDFCLSTLSQNFGNPNLAGLVAPRAEIKVTWTVTLPLGKVTWTVTVPLGKVTLGVTLPLCKVTQKSQVTLEKVT